MARDDHQPAEGAPDRPERTADQMEKACGGAIACILAIGKSPDGDVFDIACALKEAMRARVAGVVVLADAQSAVAAEKQADAARREDGVPVRILELDAAQAIAATREAGDFELFGLSYGLLSASFDAAERLSGQFDALIFMDAAQERICADHLYELAIDANEHPDAQVVVSWIQWLRRMPCWVNRTFLDTLDTLGTDPVTLGTDPVTLGTDPTPPETPASTRPLPCIRARDHVFGEEPLAAVKAPVRASVEFLDGCTMTALQAVALAEHANAHPDEELHSPNQPLSLMGPIAPRPLSASDARLVAAAQDALAIAEDCAPDELAELEWADMFGTRVRLDFPLLNDRAHAGRLAYLDSAATSQRVDVALRAQHDYDMHENANVYRGAYGLSAQSTFTFNDARKALEDFIGAERRQTVYTANATGATNLVALAWGERNISPGDLIVCCLADHHSNMLPFFMLAERRGARIEYVPYDECGRIDLRAYLALLEKRPKLVCIAQIGNVFGIEAPVKEMAAAAHKTGARVLVDAAQSFAHVKIDVKDLCADWVACSAHKAYGPMGIGALWISPDAFGEMDPLGAGGGTVSHVATDSYYLRPKALQYELGTPPVSQAVGWAAAIEYLDALGMDNIARHGAALTRYLVRGLQRIDGVNVLGDHTRPDGRTGLVSFTVRSVAPADVAGFLGKLDVAIRSGGHCALPLHAHLGLLGSNRISIGAYTTKSDIDAALAALALCREIHES